MSPFAVFVRTLLRTSAIFIGGTLVFLHPTLDWSSRTTSVTAQQSPAEAALDGLIMLLEDSDAGVRRQAADALGHVRNTRAVPALVDALDDPDPAVRKSVTKALADCARGR